MKNAHLFIAIALIVGGDLFAIAVGSTFSSLQITRSRFDPVEMVFISVLVGLVEILIGYESMILFGGKLSLGVAEFAATRTGSKQVIEIRNEEPTELKNKLIRDAYLVYVPLIVFIITVAIAWDVYNADSVHSGVLQRLFTPIDIFSRSIKVNVILYSIGVTPLILVFSFIAGIVPSIALPYFRRFKVTGVNSAPFHTWFMVTLIGIVAGISAFFTLVGLFYEVLLLEKAPLYYHYILEVGAGFSLYYAIGSYLGLGRAETMIMQALAKKRGGNVFLGSVSVNQRPDS